MPMSKIAFTADVHLTSEGHPERWNALEFVMRACVERGIEYLVIGGDLFDKDQTHFSELNKLAAAHDNVHVHVIRGNHDEGLRQSSVAASNVTVYDKTDLVDIAGNGVHWGFVPYESSKTMGAALAEWFTEKDKKPAKWVLVGHGDVAGWREINTVEKGVYMPVTQTDIARFKPDLVLLGHIHKPIDNGVIHYVGSPCGLDISESGRRRFFVVDANSLEIENIPIDTDVIWQEETFTVVPSDTEIVDLASNVQARIAAWEIPDDSMGRVKLRVRARGYARDPRAVLEQLNSELAGIEIYDGNVIADNLGQAEEDERSEIVDRVRELLSRTPLPEGPEDPDRDDVLQHVLQLVYGVK